MHNALSPARAERGSPPSERDSGGSEEAEAPAEASVADAGVGFGGLSCTVWPMPATPEMQSCHGSRSPTSPGEAEGPAKSP